MPPIVGQKAQQDNSRVVTIPTSIHTHEPMTRRPKVDFNDSIFLTEVDVGENVDRINDTDAESEASYDSEDAQSGKVQTIQDEPDENADKIPLSLTASVNALRHALANPLFYWKNVENKGYVRATYLSQLRRKSSGTVNVDSLEMEDDHIFKKDDPLLKNMAIDRHAESSKEEGRKEHKAALRSQIELEELHSVLDRIKTRLKSVETNLGTTSFGEAYTSSICIGLRLSSAKGTRRQGSSGRSSERVRAALRAVSPA